MKRTAHISKSILLVVISLPLLSALLLSITCSFANITLPCCVPDPYGHSKHHGESHSHFASPDAQNASMDHHGLPQKDSEKDHSDDDDDCCNDLTTAFFSVFQVQPPVFEADLPVPVFQFPVTGTFRQTPVYQVDQSLVYHGFDTPPKISEHGWQIRILYQSFLN